jgi:hypothetical protein
MLINRLKKRMSAASAVVALAAGFALLPPASAEAAPVYWTFRNLRVGNDDQCLTGGKINDRGTSSVFLTTCNGSNYQQWDWRGTDTVDPSYLQLQNKATGLCLATDNKSFHNNAVWASSCDWRDGMRFHYEASTHLNLICSLLPSPSVCLTGRESGAVYSDVDTDIYAQWRGSHN